MLDSRKTGWRGWSPCKVASALFVSTALALTVMPATGLAEEIGAQRGMEAPWQQREDGGHGPGFEDRGPGASKDEFQTGLVQDQTLASSVTEGGLSVQRDYDEAGAAAALLQGFKSFGASINLEAYAVPADFETLDDLFCLVVNNNPELFYVSNVFSYSYNPSSNTVLELTPTYRYGVEEAASMQAAIDASLNEIASWVPEGADVLTKAKVVHDWLVYNVTYDNVAAESGDSEYDGGTPWNAYGALVERNAVCQGYSVAFMAAMRYLGVDSGDVAYVSSDTHSWNALRYDGNWYHIDVSWDDPGVTGENYDWHEVSGYADTTYFMKSTAAIQAADPGVSHAFWEPAEIVCDSWAFDDWGWVDYNGAQ